MDFFQSRAIRQMLLAALVMKAIFQAATIISTAINMEDILRKIFFSTTKARIAWTTEQKSLSMFSS